MVVQRRRELQRFQGLSVGRASKSEVASFGRVGTDPVSNATTIESYCVSHGQSTDGEAGGEACKEACMTYHEQCFGAEADTAVEGLQAEDLEQMCSGDCSSAGEGYASACTSAEFDAADLRSNCEEYSELETTLMEWVMIGVGIFVAMLACSCLMCFLMCYSYFECVMQIVCLPIKLLRSFFLQFVVNMMKFLPCVAGALLTATAVEARVEKDSSRNLQAVLDPSGSLLDGPPSSSSSAAASAAQAAGDRGKKTMRRHTKNHVQQEKQEPRSLPAAALVRKSSTSSSTRSGQENSPKPKTGTSSALQTLVRRMDAKKKSKAGALVRSSATQKKSSSRLRTGKASMKNSVADHCETMALINAVGQYCSWNAVADGTGCQDACTAFFATCYEADEETLVDDVDQICIENYCP
eukprot:g8788.t1